MNIARHYFIDEKVQMVELGSYIYNKVVTADSKKLSMKVEEYREGS